MSHAIKTLRGVSIIKGMRLMLNWTDGKKDDFILMCRLSFILFTRLFLQLIITLKIRHQIVNGSLTSSCYPSLSLPPFSLSLSSPFSLAFSHHFYFIRLSYKVQVMAIKWKKRLEIESAWKIKRMDETYKKSPTRRNSPMNFN